MIKDYLLKLKDQLFNKKEQEYLEYINKRDLIIHDLTRDWSDEEIDSLSGATITSKAMTNGINGALEFYDLLKGR